jgi:hypothetical protein
MPIVRMLLVLLALASPALAQDGARDAAVASETAQAFHIYVEGVAKQGGRPDLTRPDVAAMLGRVFDLGALNALPPAQASDTDWLVEWHEAATATHELFLYYGAKTGPQPDRAAIGRNMAEYEDQYAAAINFLIRFQAREAVSTKIRLVAAAIRDTREVWASHFLPSDRVRLISVLPGFAKRLPDETARSDIAGLMTALQAMN